MLPHVSGARGARKHTALVWTADKAKADHPGVPPDWPRSLLRTLANSLEKRWEVSPTAAVQLSLVSKEVK